MTRARAENLIEDFLFETLIADKAYDKEEFVESVASSGKEVVIPPRTNKKRQREYDRHLYRERHLVECFINKIKHFRRVFSRFGKLSKNYLSFIHLVSSLIWLR